VLAPIEVGAAPQGKVPQTAWEKARKEGVVRVIVTLMKERNMKKKWFSYAIIVVLIFFPGVGPAQQASRPRIPPAIRQKMQEKGVARVTVGLNIPWRAEKLNPSDEARQRSDILAAQNSLLSELKGTNYKVIGQSKSTPFMDLEVDSAALSILEKSPLVKTLSNEANIEFKRFLYQSVPLIGGAAAFLAGYDGSGQTIVIIGTGIDADHPMLDGKVVAEACYQSNFACPNGQHAQFGTGAATTCIEFDDCDHETHVAGIAAGLEVTDPGTERTFSGVAKGAQIAAIRINSAAGNGNASDLISSLDYVYTVFANEFTIAAVNLSFGADYYPDQALCDADFPSIKGQIDRLRAAGIPTIIASGNERHTDGISAPACISSAVSVGATTKADTIWNEPSPSTEGSNTAAYLSLLAPGAGIYGPEPGDQYCCTTGGGTSDAAPHVAGAWAVLKQKKNNAKVGQVLNALQTTGVKITDTRSGANNRVNCRIQIDQALTYLPQDQIVSTPFQASVDGINNCGQVVGIDWDTYMGFMWDTSGLYTAITYDGNQVEEGGSLDYVEATGINNKGEVTGYYCCGYWGDRGFRRDVNGSYTQTTDSNWETNDNWGNNDAGKMVGMAWTYAGQRIGYILIGSTGTQTGDDITQDINNMDRTAGYYQTGVYPAVFHGVYYNGNGRQTFDYPGADSTEVYGINESGQIVGCYQTDGGLTYRGFFRDSDGTVVQIHPFGADGSCATGINDSGQIVGYYWNSTGWFGFVDLSR